MVGHSDGGRCTLAALLAMAVLVLVVFTGVQARGAGAQPQPVHRGTGTDAFGQPTGGIKNSIIGTVIITAIATPLRSPSGS